MSHWAVDNLAAVALVTRAFDELRDRPKIGRAEAMRLAMTAMIEGGGTAAHPQFWAPFVIVGEGAG